MGDVKDSPTLTFTVKHRANKFNLSMSASCDMNEIFDFIGEVIDIENLHCVLIVGGKKYAKTDTLTGVTVGETLTANTTLMMLSTTTEEISKIRSFKPDPLVKGFSEQERDEESRRFRTEQLATENPWGEKISQHAEYNFARVEVLYRRSSPSPYDAEKLLRKLTLDPGIIKIMQTQQYRVGTLCELDPEDADEEQAAKGEADKCLLGWNRNFGQRIALRLRTDDLTSFRKYDSIVNTLIHELTHNVHGPHDSMFWELFNSLKQLYQTVHAQRRNAPLLAYAMSQNSGGEPIQQVPRSSAPTKRLGGTDVAKSQEEMRDARLRYLNKFPK
jgi:hypothetical protein